MKAGTQVYLVRVDTRGNQVRADTQASRVTVDCQAKVDTRDIPDILGYLGQVVYLDIPDILGRVDFQDILAIQVRLV